MKKQKSIKQIYSLVEFFGIYVSVILLFVGKAIAHFVPSINLFLSKDGELFFLIFMVFLMLRRIEHRTTTDDSQNSFIVNQFAADLSRLLRGKKKSSLASEFLL